MSESGNIPHMADIDVGAVADLYEQWERELAQVDHEPDGTLVASLEEQALELGVDLLDVHGTLLAGFSEVLHPRGHDGQWIEKLGMIKIVDGPGKGDRGQVVDITEDQDNPGEAIIHYRQLSGNTQVGPRLGVRPDEVESLNEKAMIPDSRDDYSVSGDQPLEPDPRYGRRASAVTAAFNEALHPRGKDGQFIEVGGLIKLFNFQLSGKDGKVHDFSGKRGRVLGITPDKKSDKNPPDVRVGLYSNSDMTGTPSTIVTVKPNHIEAAPEKARLTDAPETFKAPDVKMPGGTNDVGLDVKGPGRGLSSNDTHAEALSQLEDAGYEDAGQGLNQTQIYHRDTGGNLDFYAMLSDDGRIGMNVATKDKKDLTPDEVAELRDEIDSLKGNGRYTGLGDVNGKIRPDISKQLTPQVPDAAPDGGAADAIGPDNPDLLEAARLYDDNAYYMKPALESKYPGITVDQINDALDARDGIKPPGPYVRKDAPTPDDLEIVDPPAGFSRPSNTSNDFALYDGKTYQITPFNGGERYQLTPYNHSGDSPYLDELTVDDVKLIDPAGAYPDTDEKSFADVGKEVAKGKSGTFTPENYNKMKAGDADSYLAGLTPEQRAQAMDATKKDVPARAKKFDDAGLKATYEAATDENVKRDLKIELARRGLIEKEDTKGGGGADSSKVDAIKSVLDAKMTDPVAIQKIIDSTSPGGGGSTPLAKAPSAPAAPATRDRATVEAELADVDAQLNKKWGDQFGNMGPGAQNMRDNLIKKRKALYQELDVHKAKEADDLKASIKTVKPREYIKPQYDYVVSQMAPAFYEEDSMYSPTDPTIVALLQQAVKQNPSAPYVTIGPPSEAEVSFPQEFARIIAYTNPTMAYSPPPGLPPIA